MYNMRNTVKGFYPNDCHVSCANFTNTDVYTIARRERNGDIVFVGTLVVATGDFFTLNLVTAEGTEVHTGIGFIEFAKKLKSLNLLHPDQEI